MIRKKLMGRNFAPTTAAMAGSTNQLLGVYYGSISLFTSILQNIFLLYHVETFVSIYKIDKMSFWIGEAIFLIWNSFNDPLFGWLSDRDILTSAKGTSSENVITRRIKALQVAGPLLGISFMAFWASWTYSSIQFVICLCLYDGFLTMIDLHHSALLADLAISTESRTKLNYYSTIFSALGASSVFLSYIFWDRSNWLKFQLFCLFLAVVSVLGYLYSTQALRRLCGTLHGHQHSQDTRSSQANCDDLNFIEEKTAFKKFIKDLSGQKNFKWFAIMNLIQVFHCHFNSNFFPLFLENLLGDSVPQIMCSLILGVSFIAPHINNLYFLRLCRRYGVYAVVHGLFILKLVLSVIMLLMGPDHMWLLALYIASNRVFTEGTCKLLTLVISDLVDEDCVLHRRKQAVSALMFGTVALLSKPGQTLAPLIGTWLLAHQTGHDVFDSDSLGDSLKLDLSSMDAAGQQRYRIGVFQLLVYIPVVCAIFQLIAWSRFNLKDEKLRSVKAIREGSAYLAV